MIAYNKLQKVLARRAKSRAIVVVSSSLFVIAAMVFTMPETALGASGTIVDFAGGTGNTSNVFSVAGGVVASPCGAGYDIGGFAYHHPSGSGDYMVSAVVSKFIKNGNPSPSNAKLIVCAFEGGAYPNASSGSLVGSGSLVADSIANSASARDIQFSFNNSFQLQAGQTYWFKFVTTATSWSSVAQIVSGGTGNFNKPFRMGYNLGLDKWERFIDNDVRFKLFGEAEPSISLTVNTSAPYTAGQQIQFTVSWTNLDYSPLYAHFFEDVNNSQPDDSIAMLTTGGTSGTFSFYHSFQYPSPSGEPYNTAIDISNCNSNYTGGGSCNYSSDLSGPSLDILSRNQTANPDTSYSSTFRINKANFFIGETATFTYDIDTSICSGGLSSARLFLGYPTNMGNADSGSLLPATSGTMYRTYNQSTTDLGTSYVPNIKLYCADGSTKTLYVRDTWNASNAVLVIVYTQQEFQKLQTFKGYANGATATGGYMLATDKIDYLLYEPIYFRWSFFNHIEPVTKVRLYLDPSSLPTEYVEFSSADDIRKDVNHYYMTTYSVSGEYYPAIAVMSGSTVNRWIYIGNGTSRNPNYPIYIEDQTYSPNLLDANDVYGSGGIFPYLKGLQIPKDPSMSIPTQALVVIANSVISSLVSLAHWGYQLLLSADIFTWWADLVAPIPNTQRTVPASLFDFDLTPYYGTDTYTDRNFVITYASTDANKFSAYYQFVFIFAIMIFITKRFF